MSSETLAAKEASYNSCAGYVLEALLKSSDVN
jgi:hypothetical protein